jgi:enoyl-CoA hydratase/carnithine racemase
MCDFRFGTAQTKFSENFVKVGLVPGDGGTFFLQRVIGYARAMELTLTGRSVHADEAVKIGLLNKICDDDKLESEVLSFAQQLAKLPPAAMQLSKKAMRHSYMHDLQSSLDLLAGYQGIAQRTSEHFKALDELKESGSSANKK